MWCSMADVPGQDLAGHARQALAAAEAALAEELTAEVADETAQQLLTAGLRLFARKVEQERRHFPPVAAPEAVTPTEVAVTVTELLQAVNLNLFDLSMWAGRPPYGTDDAGPL